MNEAEKSIVRKEVASFNGLISELSSMQRTLNYGSNPG